MKKKNSTPPSYFAHPTSTVDEGARIGKDTKIWHYSHVSQNSKIGSNCSLGQNVFIGNDVRIGNGVKIQNNVSVYNGVELEDFVFCGPSTVFTNVTNPRSEIIRKSEYKKTKIKKGATLGANSTIVCGTTIGMYAFVGAGAVVTKEIPDFALVVGVPAKLIGWVCECAMGRLAFKNSKAACKHCNKKYEKKAGNKVVQIS